MAAAILGPPHGRRRARDDPDQRASHPLLVGLARRLDLTEDERAAISSVPFRVRAVGADEVVLREGNRSGQCLLVLSGLTCLSKVVGTGGCQIAAFHLPGDLPDLPGLHLGRIDSDLWAVVPSSLAVMDHGPIRHLCAHQPRVAAALWRVTLVDAAIQREWTVNLGQRLAVERLAHLFCEVLARMEEAGLASDDVCAFPVTQADLAEATGLSTVHVNRTLQDLRQAELMSFDKGRLAVYDRAGLAERGDFDPIYLHRTGPDTWPST